jgi:hypothetical protein
MCVTAHQERNVYLAIGDVQYERTNGDLVTMPEKGVLINETKNHLVMEEVVYGYSSDAKETPCVFIDPLAVYLDTADWISVKYYFEDDSPPLSVETESLSVIRNWLRIADEGEEQEVLMLDID